MSRFFKFSSLLFGVLFLGSALIPRSARSLSIRTVTADQVIHFPAGSAEIRDVSIPLLKEVADILKNNPNTQFVIQGHSDAIENNRKTGSLSRRRAQVVKDYLISLGVVPGRLLVESYGANRPIANNESEEGRARNRRVEFKTFFPPETLEGIREVPVADLEKKFEGDKSKDSQKLLLLARINQIAYARKIRTLPVETWDGVDTYPWTQGDPSEEKLLSTQRDASQYEADAYLKKAIHYFSEIIKLPREPYIGGLPDYPSQRKLAAYRGLIWCYRQSGQEKKAEALYPKYLANAKSLEGYDERNSLSAWMMLLPIVGARSNLKPRFEMIEEMNADELLRAWDSADNPAKTGDIEKKADLLLGLYLKKSNSVMVQKLKNNRGPYLVGILPGDGNSSAAFTEKQDQSLDVAIGLYDKILAMAPTNPDDDSFYDGDVEKVRIKTKLVRAKSLRATQEQVQKMYQSLLEDAFALDLRLHNFPTASSDNALLVWHEMLQYFDPIKDSAYIQVIQERLKSAQIKSYRDNFYIY